MQTKNYKISYKKPPFQWLFRIVFGKIPELYCFTFGNTIYTNPGRQLNPAQIAHEEVHVKQHKSSKIFAFFFMIRFICSKSFRLKVEAPAYRAEWNKTKEVIRDRNVRGSILLDLAHSLSDPAYGNLVSFPEALKIIQEQ